MLLCFHFQSIFFKHKKESIIYRKIILHRLLKYELFSLTSIYLYQNTFVFREKFYTKSENLAMHSPLNPVSSDICMHYFEKKIKLLQFTYCTRYINDFFALLYLSKNNAAFNLFSSTVPCSKFAFEI